MGRGSDSLKVAGVQAALYSPGALYGPVTWNLQPHNLAAGPMPAGFVKCLDELAVEPQDDMAYFAV